MVGLLITGIWYVNATSGFISTEKSDSVKYFSDVLEGPYSVHVIEADLTNDDVSLMAWRSGGLT
ncbi:MAG TPA: hypothetical protein DCE78_07840, partial [Bacteroidetes bacterium]|nr:hypothetical protein [Bacteroidota bacterium]